MSKGFKITHYSLQRLVYQNNHHVSLEILFELASCGHQSEGQLLHRGVPLFCASECFASVVYGLLHPVFFFDQGRADESWGGGHVEK